MKSVVTIDARMILSAGIGTYLQSLLPWVIELKPEYQFHLIGNIPDLMSFSWSKSPNVKCIQCDAPIYSLREQLEISVKTPRETNLFWSPHYNIPWFCHSKLLVTVHDVFHLAMPKWTGAIHKRIYARLVFETLKRKADAVLFISRFTQNEFLRLVGEVRNKAKVVYNGAPELKFRIKKKKHPKPYFLFVGSVKPHKNLLRLVEAFKTIQDKVPHDLIIVGQKEGFITGDQAVLRKGKELGNRLWFTGKVDDHQLRRFYANADLLVFPSLYEGFGMPPLEAMISRCPVLVSDIPVFHEIYGNSVAYCDPFNAQDISRKMLQIVKKRSLRLQLIRKGLELAKHYSWEKSAKKILKVMDHLLSTV